MNHATTTLHPALTHLEYVKESEKLGHLFDDERLAHIYKISAFLAQLFTPEKIPTLFHGFEPAQPNTGADLINGEFMLDFYPTGHQLQPGMRCIIISKQGGFTACFPWPADVADFISDCRRMEFMPDWHTDIIREHGYLKKPK